jgi:hypothetical protein
MGSLLDFLQKNQILTARELPLCHSTEAYYLKQFKKTGKILATSCNVFKGENLSYFFVGRPAFKRSLGHEPEYWELPVCVLMAFDSFIPKRVYPFDSGAFAAQKYPSFINMMKMDEFEVAADTQAAQKIMGTFFSSSRNYYGLKARPQSSFESLFDVDVLEEEVRAVHRLIGIKNEKVDDRRFAIEFQSGGDVELTPDSVLAIVAPETYLENDTLRRYVVDTLKASFLTYETHPLNKDAYYMSIYINVSEFLKTKGYFDV